MFYLIITFIRIILFIILVIVYFINYADCKIPNNGHYKGLITSHLSALMSYFWYVVYCFYTQMKAGTITTTTTTVHVVKVKDMQEFA